ncbi:MAG TPA: SCP2 sterol-binding domain-containing protein [Syntrophomonas sp.]|nr:SCP2 sterol-binding domain-containing protein [Syntrophomonas sp.]
MKFLSEEWFIEFEKRCRDEFSKASNLSTELVEVYENFEGNRTIWCLFKLENGLIAQFKHGEGEDSIPSALFRTFGDYPDYVKVLKGELNPKKGLMAGTFTLEGNMMKAMGMLGTYMRVTECKKVPGLEL